MSGPYRNTYPSTINGPRFGGKYPRLLKDYSKRIGTRGGYGSTPTNEGQTDRGDIEFYNANLQAMKADRNAMVQLNQRTFPTIQESVEVPDQGISPAGKEGIPGDSPPPGEKLCYPPWREAGPVPVIASAPTRQLDPRPRTQTRPTDQMIPVRAAVNRAGTGAGNGPCFNGTRFREPRATAADGGNPTVGYCGHANADPRTTNAGTV